MMAVTFNQFMKYDSVKYGSFVAWGNTLTNGITRKTLNEVGVIPMQSMSQKLWEGIAFVDHELRPIGKFNGALTNRFPMDIIIGYMEKDDSWDEFKEEYNKKSDEDRLKDVFNLNSLEMIASEIAESDMSNDEILQKTGSNAIRLVRERKLYIPDLPISELSKLAILDNKTINLSNVQKLIDSDISAYQIESKTGVSRTTISNLRNDKADLMNLKGLNLLKLSDYAKYLISSNEL